MKKWWIIGIVVLLLAIGGGIWENSGGAPAAPPLSLSTPGGAQATPPQQAPTPTSTNSNLPVMKHLITLKTSLGSITFATYDDDAPLAVNNFITLAQKGFYNGVIFHRVIQGFMIQGGDPTGTGRGGPGYTFADELNSTTPSYKQGYVTGVVAMANAGPNTNGSQFFIMLAPTPLPHLYTIFGKVTSGQNVVNAIGALPVDANDKPLNPPVIQSVTVAPYTAN
jgi:cyclophilin family peptidyl-prolyl cis-trans isomerase